MLGQLKPQLTLFPTVWCFGLCQGSTGKMNCTNQTDLRGGTLSVPYHSHYLDPQLLISAALPKANSPSSSSHHSDWIRKKLFIQGQWHSQDKGKVLLSVVVTWGRAMGTTDANELVSILGYRGKGCNKCGSSTSSGHDVSLKDIKRYICLI